MTQHHFSLLNRGWFQVVIFCLGICVAFLLGHFTIIIDAAAYGIAAQWLVSFLVGMLYASVLTIAPATVGIVALAQAGIPLSIIAIAGGVGAMCADLTLFKIIKVGFIDRITRRIHAAHGLYADWLRVKIVRYGILILGAISIATPIPDEIGLALMGFGNAHWRFVALISIFFNTIGIGAIALLSQ